MSEPSTLLKQYKQDERVQVLVHALKEERAGIFMLMGLQGSLRQLVIHSVLSQAPSKHVLLSPHVEQATTMQSELCHLGTEAVLLPHNAKPNDWQRVLLPLYDEQNSGCWVGQIDCLDQPVISKQVLRQISLPLGVNQVYSAHALVDQLQRMGFHPTDRVEQIGTFSQRGAIIDVFSSAHLHPIRISFWGEKIARLSFFNSSDQLSNQDCDSVQVIGQEIGHESKTVSRQRMDPLSDRLAPNITIWVKGYELLSPKHQQWLSTRPCVILLADPSTPTLDQATKLHWQSQSQAQSMPPSTPQARFSANFATRAQWLLDQQNQGYTLYLSTSYAQHGRRLLETLQNYQPTLAMTVAPLNLAAGFEDTEAHIACYTEHELSGKLFRAKTPAVPTKTQQPISSLQTLSTGDYVVHIDYGIARFGGLYTRVQGDKTQEMIRLIYHDDDLLYLSIHALHKLAKYRSASTHPPKLNKLKDQQWQGKVHKTKKHLQSLATAFAELYAKRKSIQGFAYPPDPFAQVAIISSFIYEDTPDQTTATQDVYQDMEAPYPMDRLICGDVGFGKTEIAIRAAFKAIRAHKQVALLAPTTVLAMQHYRTFSERFHALDISIACLHRFCSAADLRQTIEDLSTGKLQLVIGTHKLMNPSIVFGDLGLLIIDEEQKLGVKAKEHLRQNHPAVDTLTLTATPIPRTLQFSLLGVRDISQLQTPPRNRQAIETLLCPMQESMVQQAIQYELAREGQVFIVHNHISSLKAMEDLVHRLVPLARAVVAHGQMEGTLLEDAILAFVQGTADVLICTNIVENGLDIPNANTMLIYHAQLFGLADLHQLRGRVGRSDRQAFCYLLVPPLAKLSHVAAQRLRTLESMTALGDGFKIALQDLELRGSGQLLGTEQSGFMNELGLETYHKLLDEVITEKQRAGTWQGAAISPKQHCTIEIHEDMHLPKAYIPSDAERIRLYDALSQIQNDQQLQSVRAEMIDRFGSLPLAAQTVLDSVPFRWAAERCGFSKVVLAQQRLLCVFDLIDNQAPAELLTRLMHFVQQHPSRCQWSNKNNKGQLNINQVATLVRRYPMPKCPRTPNQPNNLTTRGLSY